MCLFCFYLNTVMSDGSCVPITSTTGRVRVVSGEFLITNTHITDTSMYICNATNNFGTSLSTVHLQVFGKLYPRLRLQANTQLIYLCCVNSAFGWYDEYKGFLTVYNVEIVRSYIQDLASCLCIYVVNTKKSTAAELNQWAVIVTESVFLQGLQYNWVHLCGSFYIGHDAIRFTISISTFDFSV